MADSTTNLDLISASQASKEVTANALFDAASPATLYGRMASATSALTWGYYGGGIISGGVLTAIANGTIALTASSTNYVQATLAGVVSANTTGFTAGQIPLYTIITGAATVTSYFDQRAFLFAAGPAATVTTNANLTGPITSVGNATAVASQTGTGSTFVMSAAPTISGIVSVPNTLLTTGDSVTTGDTININLTAVASYTASKAANTVTATVGTFSAADVNRILVWAVGTTLVYDRIATYISPTQVTVDHAGTIASQAATTYGPPMLYADNVNNIASIGKVNITVPANGATLTLSDGKTLASTNSLTLSGTDGSTLNVGAGGTLGTAAFVADSGLVHIAGTETISGAKTFSGATQTVSGRILQGGVTDNGVSGIQATDIRIDNANGSAGAGANGMQIVTTTPGNGAGVVMSNALTTTGRWQFFVKGGISDFVIGRDVLRDNIILSGNQASAFFPGPNSGAAFVSGNYTILASSGSDAAFVPIVSRGNASQTANLQEWQNSSGAALAIINKNGAVETSTTITTGGYTVGTLPAGTIGMRAYVTDATAPTWLGALTGGGAVNCPVFFNGTAWVAG